MTCVIGIVSEGNIWMGADRSASGGNVIRTRADPKVFKRHTAKGDFLIGYSTSYRMGQVLQYQLSIPQYNDEDIMDYMVNKFIESVRGVLKSSGFAEKQNEVEQGGWFLVGFRSHLFCIQADYQVARVAESYTAIGTGEEFALGSLYSTEILLPEDRIAIAIRAADRFNPFVSLPFDIMSLEI